MSFRMYVCIGICLYACVWGPLEASLKATKCACSAAAAAVTAAVTNTHICNKFAHLCVRECRGQLNCGWWVVRGGKCWAGTMSLSRLRTIYALTQKHMNIDYNFKLYTHVCKSIYVHIIVSIYEHITVLAKLI